MYTRGIGTYRLLWTLCCLPSWFTGGFRIGVRSKIDDQSLIKKTTGIPEDILPYKVIGELGSNSITFQALILEENWKWLTSKSPTLFICLRLRKNKAALLGDVNDWSVEHKCGRNSITDLFRKWSNSLLESRAKELGPIFYNYYLKVFFVNFIILKFYLLYIIYYYFNNI